MLEKILPAYGWRISGFRMRTSKRATVESKDSCGSVVVPQLPMVLPKYPDNFMEYGDALGSQKGAQPEFCR